MDAFTCSRLRSLAIAKRTGACSDAATVCPTSTLRAMTTPSMGVRDDGVRQVHLRLADVRRRLGDRRLAAP